MNPIAGVRTGLRTAGAAVAALAIVFAPAYPPADFSTAVPALAGDALGPRILAPAVLDAVAGELWTLSRAKHIESPKPAVLFALALPPLPGGFVAAALATRAAPQTIGFETASRGPPPAR